MKPRSQLPDGCVSEDATGGMWLIRVGAERTLFSVQASWGLGWDHVSIAPREERRTPTWAELEKIKRLFFRDDETAMQLHVPPARHKSIHPYVLHLWRPQEVQIPMPPEIFV